MEKIWLKSYPKGIPAEIDVNEFSSLKHEKDDVREVRTGFECGVGLKNFHDIEAGDLLECYVLEKSE